MTSGNSLDHNPPPLAASRQLLLVTADDWASTTAQLRRFERPGPDTPWQQIASEISVSLGRAGLAWGIGRHASNVRSGKIKREGDGCAPAGIFALTALFGVAPPDSLLARSARLPYYTATADLKCIDDPASRYYNQLLDQRQVPAIDWTSHEDMLRPDARYTIGAVIGHNSSPPRADAGSCIFLHVWQAPGVPTAGCTAGALTDIASICRWLDSTAFPCLVQLPLAQYQRFRNAWQLPPLSISGDSR